VRKGGAPPRCAANSTSWRWRMTRTMRSFVLSALKDKGLTVTDDDLLDLHKQRPVQGL
jgi:hypothetical protein